VGATDAHVVGHESFEEGSRPAGIVEHQGARHLHLAHGQLPPVPGCPVGVGERGGNVGDPAVEEGLDVGGSEPVAEGLEPVGTGAGSEPVDELAEGDPRPTGPALSPLVAVDPHLGGIRKVGADLDEAGAEVPVQHIEVVDADPALLLGPREVDPARGGPSALGGAVDPLELLGGHDGHDAVATVALGPLQVRPDMVQLAVVPARPVRLLQLQDRDAAAGSKALHLLPETVPDLLHQGR
jgi:hypothetical protein